MKDNSKSVSLNFCLTDFFFCYWLAKSSSYTVLEIRIIWKKKLKIPTVENVTTYRLLTQAMPDFTYKFTMLQLSIKTEIKIALYSSIHRQEHTNGDPFSELCICLFKHDSRSGQKIFVFTQFQVLTLNILKSVHSPCAFLLLKDFSLQSC